MSARHTLTQSNIHRESDRRQFHLFGKLENLCVCVQSTRYKLTGWLVGLSVFLAFDMSKTSVFRLKSLSIIFTHTHTHMHSTHNDVFGSLLFFIFHPDLDSKNSFDFYLNNKRPKRGKKEDWAGGSHATIKISSKSENTKSENARAKE